MATHQNRTQSANADRQNNAKSITWKTLPLTDKKDFRFKDCKTWNRYRQNNTAQYLRAEGGPDYSPCASLNLPTDPNPWNILRSVIDQFYQREIDITRRLLKAQEATEKAQQLEEKREMPANANTQPGNASTSTYYTLEDCRAYNDFQRGMCKQYSSDCHLLTISENPHPWEGIHNLIELYYDRERQLRFTLQEIGRLKVEKDKVQEIADIALKGLYKLEEKVNAAH